MADATQHPSRAYQGQDGNWYLNGATLYEQFSGTNKALKVNYGATALDGSNPTAVSTGLTTIVAFTATLQGASAPALSTSVLTVTVSGGTASVYAWKPTGAGDTTLIASTGTETFQWVAIGS